MKFFKFYRRKKGGYWVKTAYRGWITKHQYQTYILYGFDPVILEEEYYKTKDEINQSFFKSKELDKKYESKI